MKYKVGDMIDFAKSVTPGRGRPLVGKVLNVTADKVQVETRLGAKRTIQLKQVRGPHTPKYNQREAEAA